MAGYADFFQYNFVQVIIYRFLWVKIIFQICLLEILQVKCFLRNTNQNPQNFTVKELNGTWNDKVVKLNLTYMKGKAE